MFGLQHRGGAQQPFRRHPHQAVGDQADAFLQARFPRLPCAAAQTVQQPFLVPVAGQEFDILDRQIQPITARIFQRHAVMGHACGLDGGCETCHFRLDKLLVLGGFHPFVGHHHSAQAFLFLDEFRVF